MSPRLETHGLLVKMTDGHRRRNPLVKIAADAASDMIRFAFCLTPVARSRVTAGVLGQTSGGAKTGC
jgi:phage terminase small subunit